MSHKLGIVDHIVKIVNIEITIQDQIQINPHFCQMTDPIQTLEIGTIQTKDQETLHTTDTENILTIEIETIQTIGNLDIKIIDHAIILTTYQNKTIIKLDHATVHTIEIQVITTDKGTTLNHHIGITQVIIIHNKIIGVIHLNIKDK